MLHSQEEAPHFPELSGAVLIVCNTQNLRTPGIFPSPLMPTASQLIHSYSVGLLRACQKDKQSIHNIAAAESQHNHDSSTAAAQSQHNHDSSTAAAQSQHGHGSSTAPNGSSLCSHLQCMLKKILFVTTLKTVYELSSSDDRRHFVSVSSH